MTVESVHVNTVYPHSDTRYEWVEATVDFAVDPELLANERIVDLELAPRDADGLVRFDADLKLLRPVDGGNGKLLFVVPNRGVPTLRAVAEGRLPAGPRLHHRVLRLAVGRAAWAGDPRHVRTCRLMCRRDSCAWSGARTAQVRTTP